MDIKNEKFNGIDLDIIDLDKLSKEEKNAFSKKYHVILLDPTNAEQNKYARILHQESFNSISSERKESEPFWSIVHNSSIGLPTEFMKYYNLIILKNVHKDGYNAGHVVVIPDYMYFSNNPEGKDFETLGKELDLSYGCAYCKDIAVSQKLRDEEYFNK